MSVSIAKQQANRANAALSTGPASTEGKAKVSLNAVTTGLTGRTVLLPTDDVAAYEALISDVQTKWQPATPEEQRLTQALADTEWRLMFIPELETGIYAVGYRELAGEFADVEDPGARRSAIRTQIFLTYMRQLNKLSVQESRLRRQREKDTAALKQLQFDRKAEVGRRLNEAARQYIEAVEEERNNEWEPADFGFEFSKEKIELRALDIKPDLFNAYYARHPEQLAA